MWNAEGCCFHFIGNKKKTDVLKTCLCKLGFKSWYWSNYTDQMIYKLNKTKILVYCEKQNTVSIFSMNIES